MIAPVRGNRCPEKVSGLGTDSQQVMLRHPPRSHPSNVQVLTSCDGFASACFASHCLFHIPYPMLVLCAKHWKSIGRTEC